MRDKLSIDVSNNNHQRQQLITPSFVTTINLSLHVVTAIVLQSIRAIVDNGSCAGGRLAGSSNIRRQHVPGRSPFLCDWYWKRGDGLGEFVIDLCDLCQWFV
jgi:hypothetical protein